MKAPEARAMATSHGRRHSNSPICQTDVDLKGEGRVSGMESEKDDGGVIKTVLVAILLPLLLLLLLLLLLSLLFGATLGREPRESAALQRQEPGGGPR